MLMFPSLQDANPPCKVIADKMPSDSKCRREVQCRRMSDWTADSRLVQSFAVQLLGGVRIAEGNSSKCSGEALDAACYKVNNAAEPSRQTRARRNHRCNIEARRLHMHIVDKQQDVTKVLEELCQWASPIYGAMNKWWVRRRNVNEHLLR